LRLDAEKICFGGMPEIFRRHIPVQALDLNESRPDYAVIHPILRPGKSALENVPG